jgi:hypothetical protein
MKTVSQLPQVQDASLSIYMHPLCSMHQRFKLAHMCQFNCNDSNAPQATLHGPCCPLSPLGPKVHHPAPRRARQSACLSPPLAGLGSSADSRPNRVLDLSAGARERLSAAARPCRCRRLERPIADLLAAAAAAAAAAARTLRIPLSERPRHPPPLRGLLQLFRCSRCSRCSSVQLQCTCTPPCRRRRTMQRPLTPPKADPVDCRSRRHRLPPTSESGRMARSGRAAGNPKRPRRAGGQGPTWRPGRGV